MSYVVYWLDCGDDGYAPEPVVGHEEFTDLQMTEALAFMQRLRNAGMRHVTFSAENPNSVGKAGVDSVVDGKTPDGHDYEWSKQHRGHPGL